MKTTLDGVVFLLPHVSSHAKTEFHRRRIFPGPSGGRGNGMRRSGESAGQRVAGGKAAGRQGGKAAGGRLQGSGRQDGGRQDGGRQGGKVAGRQSGRAAKWQDGAAGRSGKTERQDGAAGRSGRTEQQDGAAGRSGRTERQKKRGGEAASSQRTDPGRRPHKQKTGETHNVPPVLAPGFQPPGAAGQRKSARRSSPASAKGQRTGSQYAVRTPGRVQYYPHGRR